MPLGLVDLGPTHVFDTVSISLLAIALTFFVRERTAIARTLSCAGVVVGFIPFFIPLHDTVQSPEGFPVHAHSFIKGHEDLFSISLILITAILIAARPLKSSTRTWVTALGIVSTFLVVANIAILVSKLAGIELTSGFGFANHIRIRSLFCLMTLNLALGLIAYKKSQFEGWRQSWVPYPVALGVVVGTFVLCSAQIESEIKNKRLTSDANADGMRDQLRSRIKTHSLAFGRMASRIASDHEEDHLRWAKDAANYLADNPEFRTIEWIEKDGSVRWVEPQHTHSKEFHRRRALEPNQKSAIDVAMKKGILTISRPFKMASEHVGFQYSFPLLPTGKFKECWLELAKSTD